MSDQHLTRFEILALIEGTVDPADGDSMWTHIEHCNNCWMVYEEVSFVMRATLEHVEDDGLEADLVETWRIIAADAEHSERDARAAEELFVQLARHPEEKWGEIITANPQVGTPALVQRLVAAAGLELDRKPDHALVLLNVAETIAYTLEERATLRSRGHVWKQRSNTYRMAARYEEAIDASFVAAQLYAELRAPDSNFEIGQARYAMAAALTKMTRFPAALKTLRSARDLLEEYGESAPLAKVTMLEASIRLEQGEVSAARNTLRELLPVAERLGEQLEVGRVRLNLAECNLRLGELDAAIDEARAAIDIFTALGNVAERARGEWTLVMVRIAQGEATAIRDLEPIAALYKHLGMPGEAGFVMLDLTELLLQSEEWSEAAELARDLVTLFTAAGVTLASVNAVHYLRTAVENREATAETVRYVRSYVATDDPERPFEPPVIKPS